MNHGKKYFWTQKSDKIAGVGSEIPRIRIRKIRNSKVPILTYDVKRILHSLGRLLGQQADLTYAYANH